MTTEAIIVELQNERARINVVIAALTSADGQDAQEDDEAARKAAYSQKMSGIMKARWAKRRKH